MAEPLPNTQFSDPGVHSAYLLCQQDEAKPDNGASPSTVMLARLLGYLLLKPATSEGSVVLARGINNAPDQDKRVELGQLYLDHLIRVFLRSESPRPPRSEHPSRSLFNDARDFLEHLMESGPSNHSSTKYKALTRDGYRCVISHTPCRNAMRHGFINSGRGVFTELAHIIPAYITHDVDGETRKEDKAFHTSLFWTIACRYGGLLYPDVLMGAAINGAQNGLTLDPTVHRDFDSLQLWLEQDTKDSTKYHVCATCDDWIPGPRTVWLINHHPLDIALPDPQFLALHAACARAAWKSGAGDYLMRLERDLEFTSVLAPDGSSANLLTHALSKLQGAVE